MSITDQNTIDIIGIGKDTNDVNLTIADHLDWLSEQEHLLLLENKINTYIQFIESGEIHESYPSSVGRQPVIHIYFKHKPTGTAVEFLTQVETILQQAGIYIEIHQGIHTA